MTLDAFRGLCLSYPGTTEEMPFGPDVLVFKVVGKMFALCDVARFESVNLKCDPERAVELRASFEGITPGYHMNKVHWNTVACDGSVPDALIVELLTHSHALVVASLNRTQREALKTMR